MKIKRIIIELEPGEKDLPGHATVIEWFAGMWAFDGPIYSRITPCLHEAWKAIKAAVVQD